MTIGELAKRAGASVRSIRHYQAAGLIAADRHANNYRDFGPDAVAQVRQIVQLIGVGFNLAEIAGFPACMRLGEADTPCEVTLAAHRAKLAAIETEIAELERRRGALRSLIRDAVASAAEARNGAKRRNAA